MIVYEWIFENFGGLFVVECLSQVGNNLRCYGNVHKSCSTARFSHYRLDAAGGAFLQTEYR